MFSSDLKLRNFYKIPLQSETKTIKIWVFLAKFVKFQALGMWRFLLILIRFLQCFKIVSHHAQKVHHPKFFFEVFIICHDFTMNIVGIESEPRMLSLFSGKTSMGMNHTAYHELKHTLRIHWYSTGPTIYNWNPLFQHWYTMGQGSGCSKHLKPYLNQLGSLPFKMEPHVTLCS